MGTHRKCWNQQNLLHVPIVHVYSYHSICIFLASYHLTFLPHPESVWLPSGLLCLHNVSYLFTCCGYMCICKHCRFTVVMGQKYTFYMCMCSQIIFPSVLYVPEKLHLRHGFIMYRMSINKREKILK